MEKSKSEKEKPAEKPKLISEKINSKFQEVKKDKPKEEEIEEEIDEAFEEDFFAGERTAPVLQSSNQQQTIEQQVASAPSTPQAERKAGDYEEATRVYNMPEYAGTKLYESERQMQQEVRPGRIPTPISIEAGMNFKELQQRPFSAAFPMERPGQRQEQEDIRRKYEIKPQDEPRRSAGRRR